MDDLIHPDIAAIGIRLCDDAYMVWLAAAADAENALRAWFDATPGERVSRYFAYRAALDREEAAARDLERLSELSQPCEDALLRHSEATQGAPAPDREPVSGGNPNFTVTHL